MSSVRYWVWLSSVSYANPGARSALITHYGSAERAYMAPPGEFEKIPGVSAAEAQLFEKRDLGTADRILEICVREQITILTMQDAAYPHRLMNIFAPPVALYVKGRLPDVDTIPSVAVIGTRKATPYGIKMGTRLAWEIAESGAIVISGLTEGIDRAAARGCLLAGGTCIGVLGTSHGRESSLSRDVAAAGALVSEYPPGTETIKRFFRDRNRISSGLSHAVCVVEAPVKSGSLLFVREALEQGREIFAVPGNADAENSAGTIALIKQGARPVTCGWDILEDFAVIYPGTLRRVEGTATATPDQTLPDKENETPPASEKEAGRPSKKEIDKQNPAGYIDLREQLAHLSEEQLRIIMAIDQGEIHIDDIIEATGLSTAKVLSQLTILEIRGYVRRLPGRRIGLNIKSK